MPSKQKINSKLSLASEEWPIERFLTYRILKLSLQLSRQGGAILRRTNGLKMPEWRVIAFLGARGSLTAAKISELAGVDPGQLSRAFRSLEHDGLIVARRSEQDRREIHAELTKKGRAVFDQTRPKMAARQRALMEALDPTERAAVFKIIDKLELAVGRSDDERT